MVYYTQEAQLSQLVRECYNFELNSLDELH